MIADHTYIDYNNPEMSRQFNNVAVFTFRETYVNLRYFSARIKIKKTPLVIPDYY